MQEKYQFRIPNKTENVSLIRLAASFVAMKLNFDIEKIEDIKVCAAEACNYQIHRTENFEVKMIGNEDRLEIQFEFPKISPQEEETKFSVMIVQSLSDECEFNADSIKIVFRRG